MRRSFMLLLSLCTFTVFALGCATLTEKGNRVMHTDHPASVEDCEFVGEVKASPPYLMGMSSVIDKLREAAGQLGADTVYRESGPTATTGRAYRCRQR